MAVDCYSQVATVLWAPATVHVYGGIVRSDWSDIPIKKNYASSARTSPPARAGTSMGGAEGIAS